jgi:protein-disulfide isomerase
MEINEPNLENTNTKQPITPWIVTILFAAWLIGMGILGAGWLISKELSTQSGGSKNPDPASIVNNDFVDIQVPADKLSQGSSDAKVTIIEFADYQCRFCNQWHQEIYPQLKSEYIDTGKVKFVYWDFPFLGEESFKSAEASLCARDQNKFWEYHDGLYGITSNRTENELTDQNLVKLATDLKFNMTDFNKCFNTRMYKTIVTESADAGTEYGVDSTPTVIVNKMKFAGLMPWKSFKQIIDTELAK